MGKKTRAVEKLPTIMSDNQWAPEIILGRENIVAVARAGMM